MNEWLAESDLREDQELAIAPADGSLITDLYELTMAACYVGEGLAQRQASFELTVRHLPQGFGYLVAMGLAQAIAYLQQLRFSNHQLDQLKSTGLFDHAPAAFWTLLAEAEFTGDVWAVPEGTVVFAHEPLLRVEAPLWQAQLVETYLLNAINYQTLIATKAARMRDAAGPEAILLEFGSRRAFSPQASVWAARAALAAGLDATSNVLAALKLNRQPSGTMAHSLVMALSALEGNEDQAFMAFHRYFPGATLLIDTYDTLAAAERLAPKVRAGELQLVGVRLDSGDLLTLSQRVRELLPGVAIYASGDISETKIAHLRAAGACIDGYGIGTQLVTGEAVNGVYKLVEIDNIPVMKESSHKQTYPGRKQIFRSWAGEQLQQDRLGLATEAAAAAEHPLLQLVVHRGQPVNPPESLQAIAERTRASVTSLPAEIRHLFPPFCQKQTSMADMHMSDAVRKEPMAVAVQISAELQALIESVRHQSPRQPWSS